MTVSDFLSIHWGGVEGPFIEPPRLSPIIADPSFLFPEETPDGRWELFAHSAWGVHRYSSADGLVWDEHGIVMHNAMRPFVRALGRDAAGKQNYGLYFEEYPPLALPLTALPIRRPWRSRISLARSADLARWSEPSVLVEPLLPWTRERSRGESVSNPCLVEDWTDGWRLYYSASLVWVEDCGFCEPRYIALARGASPVGPFAPEAKPVIDPAKDKTPGVLGAGAIKVLAMEDGYAGLQNKIYSGADGRSHSAIFLLRSEDGISWLPAREAPLIAPQEGWTESHVYACDCRFREADGLWYLYFNARDGWRISEGRERIGRITGRAR